MYSFSFKDNDFFGTNLWETTKNDLLEHKNDIIDNIKVIANKSLKELSKDNSKLLVFPTSFNTHDDNIEDTSIFKLSEKDIVKTGNLMGFIGTDKVNFTITSRFDSGVDKQYFMQYMLQKVFSINLVDLSTKAGNENIWDFLLMYMFPYYLNKALNQGLYKEYKKVKHNNANVKGAIDVARHIRHNIPFAGKVAYNTREFSFDNPTTQLIRHTIEFIASKVHSNALSNKSDTIDFVKQIRSATPTYNIRERQSVIHNNYKSVNHPYFTEYEDLRIICQKILHQDGLSMQNEKEKVHGLLFDGAWLWEEYLNTLLKPMGYIHPESNTGKNPVSVFKNSNKHEWYPDFYDTNKSIVIDAKYKKLDSKNIDNDDLHQVISYMYRLKAKRGILLYPSECSSPLINDKKFILHEDSYGAGKDEFIKLGLSIPNSVNEYDDFKKEIRKRERKLKESSIILTS